MAGRDNDWTALVLGGIATVLGWQTSRITEDIRSTRSVAYWTESSVDEKGRTIALTIIENVSKDKMLGNIKFMIRCKKGALCIHRYSARLKTFAPTLTEETLLEETPQVDPGNPSDLRVSALNLKTTLASGGRVGLIYEPVPGQPAPEFFFVPDPAEKLDILVFEGNTVRGFVVRRYFEVMSIAFVMTLAALIVILLMMFRKNKKAGARSLTSRSERFKSRLKR